MIALIVTASVALAGLEKTPPPEAQVAKPVAAKPLTLMITGDNRGEIAPCG